ncbi:MAG: hypothetical protein ACLSUZ_02220 [Bifidobacterium pseudocatenulatum]
MGHCAVLRAVRAVGVWAHPQAISTWGDSAVEVPWTLYMESGDVQVLADSYDLIRD